MSTDPRKLAAIEAALERAANAAIHGSQQVKSGQLDVEIERQRALIKRIVQEAQAAYLTWAHWEAINDQLAAKQTQAAMDYFELYSINTVRLALASSAYLSAFRLSDQPAPDKVSLCKVAEWLKRKAVVERLSSEQWALDLGHRPRVAQAAAKKNEDSVKRFKDMVAAGWPTTGKPAVDIVDPVLFDLRETLRDFRNSQLAHLLDLDPNALPTYDQIRKLVELTLELSTDMAFVLLGSGVDADSFKTHARKQATRLWSLCLKAPLEGYQQHHQSLLTVGFADEVD